MFKLLLIATLFGLLAAADIDRTAEVRSIVNDPSDGDGNFAYSFDTTNGIAVQEAGNSAGVNGAAQWVSPEGVPIQLTYTADENGYHPSGDHLPTPPPIPEAILRALEYIRTHPPKKREEITYTTRAPQPTYYTTPRYSTTRAPQRVYPTATRYPTTRRAQRAFPTSKYPVRG